MKHWVVEWAWVLSKGLYDRVQNINCWVLDFGCFAGLTQTRWGPKEFLPKSSPERHSWTSGNLGSGISLQRAGPKMHHHQKSQAPRSRSMIARTFQILNMAINLLHVFRTWTYGKHCHAWRAESLAVPQQSTNASMHINEALARGRSRFLECGKRHSGSLKGEGLRCDWSHNSCHGVAKQRNSDMRTLPMNYGRRRTAREPALSYCCISLQDLIWWLGEDSLCCRFREQEYKSSFFRSKQQNMIPL